jgi:hypothetical protein
MTTTSVRLADLVEDLDFYPRSQVSSVNVTNLVSAIEAGAELPPIIADEKSKRVVDGFHRRRAYLKVLGSDASVQVELRSYATDADLFADAVSTNARHGLPLQEIEKRRIVFRLQDMGVDDGQIAVVLQTSPDKVQKIQLKVATIVDDNGGSVRLEPLKRAVFHMQGSAMTEAQAKAHRSAPGTSYLLTIRQVRDAVKFDLIDKNDERHIAALEALLEDLRKYLGH